MAKDEQIVTSLFDALAVLEGKLRHKALELRRTFPNATDRRIDNGIEFFDNETRALRERLGLPKIQPPTRGGWHWEGIVVTGSIDAHLPETDGVVWDIALARRGLGWTIHRWLTAYFDADPALYYEGRQEITANFPDIEVADSAELIDLLPFLTDELLATEIPTRG